ncbi:hypothetical protein [Flammeovirga sp. EKP202]|uniref:hypothetical protein n=1 Tax=Flammeovirga sp. EKP202 TaxID=2770592 RepID=UPI00165EEC4E|nr:hypothetical protein [Flammeovirga sp. EKP202]MBD0401835.1 hypothetical protein [Flammeovirga sp. EKP202]
MTKYLLLLLVAGVSSCITSSPNNLTKSKHLKGDVFQIIEKKYYANLSKGGYSIKYEDNLSYDITTYNSQNNRVKKEYINREGEVFWYIEDVYDANGNLISKSSFFDHQLESKFKNRIEDDKVMETTYYGKDGKIRRTSLRKYEGDSLYIVTELDTTGEIHMISDIRKEGGKIVSMMDKFPTGKRKRSIKYELNSAGDITKRVEENFQDGKSKVNHFEYDYDQKGNWVKKYHFSQNKQLLQVSVRNIIYLEDEKKPITQNTIHGEWFVFGTKADKLVLNDDYTFSLGKKETSEVTGSWSLNTKKHQLILKQTNKENEIVFDCSLKGKMLYLQSKDIEELLQLERRAPILEGFIQKVSEKAFLKKWKIQGRDNAYIEFLPDNIFAISRSGEVVEKGYWKLNDNILLLKEDEKSREREFIYDFNDKHLKIFDTSGNIIFLLEEYNEKMN